MNYVFIIFFFLITSSSFAEQTDPCKNKYHDDVKIYGKKITAENSCQLKWIKNNKMQALQVFLRKKECVQYTDEQAVDCVMTRYCPPSKNQDTNYGQILYYSGNSKVNTICTKGQKEEIYPILGLKEDYTQVPYKAFVKCVNGQPKGIILKSGTGKEKLCEIPSFKN